MGTEKRKEPDTNGRTGNRTRMEERVTGRRRQNEEPDKRRTETGREKTGRSRESGEPDENRKAQKDGYRRKDGKPKRKRPDDL